MEERGLNGMQLAKEIGLPKNAVSEWRSGKAKPSTDAVVKIANYFNVSTDFLLGRTHTQSPVLTFMPGKGDYPLQIRIDDELFKDIEVIAEAELRTLEAQFEYFLMRGAEEYTYGRRHLLDAFKATNKTNERESHKKRSSTKKSDADKLAAAVHELESIEDASVPHDPVVD